MNRRQFLTFSALSISLSGCIGGDFGESTEDTTPTSKATETHTPRNTATEMKMSSPEGVTPECWPSMCKETKLVEVVVADGFSRDVTLQADCRSEEYSIQSGGSVQIDREKDAETCGISLSIDGEQKVSENIKDYESLTLSIDSNGEVEDEWVVT
jgi:hypothetical protein